MKKQKKIPSVQNTKVRCARHLPQEIRRAGFVVMDVRTFTQKIRQHTHVLLRDSLSTHHFDNAIQLLGCRIVGFSWTGQMLVPRAIRKFVNQCTHLFVRPANEVLRSI